MIAVEVDIDRTACGTWHEYQNLFASSISSLELAQLIALHTSRRTVGAI